MRAKADNTVDRPVIICRRCGHSWRPRRDRIKRCPNQKCQTVFWKETYQEAKERKANDTKPNNNQPQ